MLKETYPQFDTMRIFSNYIYFIEKIGPHYFSLLEVTINYESANFGCDVKSAIARTKMHTFFEMYDIAYATFEKKMDR